MDLADQLDQAEPDTCVAELRDYQYPGVHSIRTMFNTLSDQRIAWAMRRSELKDMARVVGITLPAQRVTEPTLVSYIREALDTPQDHGVDPRVCECAGRGRRWEKSDTSQPVLVYIDDSVETLYGGSTRLIAERLDYLSTQTARLIFDYVTNPHRADMVIAAGESDGRHGTLGFTSYYDDGTEDLDVFGAEAPGVFIVMDPAEVWDADFLRTVVLHELLHGVGLAHINTPGNLLQPFYAGIQLELGPLDRASLVNLYGDALIA